MRCPHLTACLRRHPVFAADRHRGAGVCFRQLSEGVTAGRLAKQGSTPGHLWLTTPAWPQLGHDPACKEATASSTRANSQTPHHACARHVAPCSCARQTALFTTRARAHTITPPKDHPHATLSLCMPYEHSLSAAPPPTAGCCTPPAHIYTQLIPW